MNRRSVLVILVSLWIPLSASGQEAESGAGAWRLHINGVAIHFDKDEDTNEKNWGLGIQQSLGRSESDTSLWDGWDLFWEVDAYMDSFSDLAVAGGVGAQRPLFRYVDWGLKAGLAFEPGLAENHGSPILPYVLPFAETRFDYPLNLRATLVPPIDALGLGGLISFQLILDLP